MKTKTRNAFNHPVAKCVFGFTFSIVTVPEQIEWRRTNFRPGFFGAVIFKFEPNMTVLIKNLAQKVDF